MYTLGIILGQLLGVEEEILVRINQIVCMRAKDENGKIFDYNQNGKKYCNSVGFMKTDICLVKCLFLR